MENGLVKYIKMEDVIILGHLTTNMMHIQYIKKNLIKLKPSLWIDKNYFILKKKLDNIKNPEWSDIYHEVLIQFLTMDTKKSTKLIEDGEAYKYIMSMFKINCYSKTSPFHWKYNKMVYDKNFDMDKIDITDGDEPDENLCLADIELALDKIDEFFVYKLIYKDYLEKKTQTPGYSFKKISIESEIPKPTIIAKFGEMKEQIKKIIDEI